MENNIVLVEKRNVYGIDLIYPVNEKAKYFANLTRRKTFDLKDLDAIKALGFQITAKQQDI